MTRRDRGADAEGEIAAADAALGLMRRKMQANSSGKCLSAR